MSEVNEDLLWEVASHILTRASHVSVIDKRGAGKTHFRDLVYDTLSEGPRIADLPSFVSGKSRALLHGNSTPASWMGSSHPTHWRFTKPTLVQLTKSAK